MSGSDGFRLGIDVGGTFTDFTLIDDGGGEGRHFKVPSTPADPAAAIGRGMLAMFADLALDPSNCRQLSHGTTVATNMVIERRGGRTGLLTTKGFRDILEIGRQDRPHLYDIHARKPPPLVPRHLRFEIAERIDADGAVLTPLDEAEVAAAARRLGEAGVEAVAIGFLHAYRFPEHERRARDIVAELLPGVPISTSSEVLPEYREYERFSTTAMNAYLSPRMGGYLDRFRRRVAEAGVPVPPSTSHSNGGLMSPAVAARYPVRACLSGPSAGVIGACRLAAAAGFQDLITFDVGGTSTDVSLIVDGRPGFTADRAVAGYPIRCPMVDVQVIGAGGGSIAWLDDAGALHVGPRSAAAEPGPAAYGRGGDGATITDANVVLHALNPVALLDGRMAISEDAARAALSRRVAEPLGLAVEAAAVGILRIAVANMARAIRAISTEQGHEVENFVLAAYGGAGPLHAARVAEEVGIDTILVPPSPGTLCARGALLADISSDFVSTEVAMLDETSWRGLLERHQALRAGAEDWLTSEGIAPGERRFRVVVEARYLGQNHEIQVASGLDGLADFARAFHRAHRATHQYDLAAAEIELVNLRLTASGLLARPVRPMDLPQGAVADAVDGERRIYLDGGAGWSMVPVLRRERLPAARPFEGPCVVEEATSTTLVPAGLGGRVDGYGNIILTREGKGDD